MTTPPSNAVRLRDEATGWARIRDDIELTEAEPVLDGLTEREADELVQTQWALVHADESPSGDAGGDIADPPVDPSALTLDELEAALEGADYSDGELDAIEAAEAAGDDRTGAADLIDAAREG